MSAPKATKVEAQYGLPRTDLRGLINDGTLEALAVDRSLHVTEESLHFWAAATGRLPE